MAEYIDRDLLKRAVHASDLENREKMALLTCISSIPAADVEPVRHGRWQTHLGWGWVWRCSCCEYKMGRKEFFKIKRDYCPNCGAKMDGGLRNE